MGFTTIFKLIKVYFCQPSEFNTYYDIEAVYNCLKNEYGIKQEDIILYGQSVGSGPTLHLASRLHRLRGVVLHSAILSGIRVLYNVKLTFWFDIFKVSSICSYFAPPFHVLSNGVILRKTPFIYMQNIDKIRNVCCPVLVIHVRNALPFLPFLPLLSNTFPYGSFAPGFFF